MRASVLAACTVTLSALAAASAVAFELPKWQSQHFQNNPLVGTVQTAEGEAASFDTLVEALRAADYVLLGEIHDNPDHHTLQARLLSAVVDGGKKPAVVFEMIPEGLRDELEAFLASDDPQAARLGDVLGWEERGWPDWRTYQPIAEIALANDLPIRSGDLDRDMIQALGREGAAALDADTRERLGLDRPIDAATEGELAETIREAHCGLMPEGAIAPMTVVQRARDGALADAMIRARAENGSAVLIAGSGHVRADRAVPALIRAREPDARIVAIQLAEVAGNAGEDPPAEAAAPFDFTLWTPRADVTDHCAALREQMGGGK